MTNKTIHTHKNAKSNYTVKVGNKTYKLTNVLIKQGKKNIKFYEKYSIAHGKMDMVLSVPSKGAVVIRENTNVIVIE